MQRRFFKQIVALFLTIAILLPLAGTDEDSIVIDNAAFSNDDVIIEPMEADEALPIETEISLGGETQTTAVPEDLVQNLKGVPDDLTLGYVDPYTISATENKRIDVL